ncbi:MAG: ATP-dependent DNA helicase [Methanomicrobiaceae archaeon]|nr:ATP-dependent DNA helicase [Methanomicrobiaceae archaeon]
MDSLDSWFPYDSYRPGQRRMLDFAMECVSEGRTTMIDAPTGSGKSSVVAACLAAAEGRKVVVAVRTVSQLSTFIREIDLIRKKRGGLKCAFLIGKRTLCPMACEGDAYRVCEGLKAFSGALMRERAQKGALVPAQDPFVRQQMQRVSAEKPLICPYFIRSRAFSDTADGLRMIPSATLRARAQQASTKLVVPERLWEIAGDLCPYEMMLQAARDADVVVLNFHHIFNDAIREQMYQSLDIEAGNTLLLVDEAHNCGDTIQSIQSVVIDERTLETASHELHAMRNRVRGADAVLSLIPRILQFLDALHRSRKTEDWFDPTMLKRGVLAGSLYASLGEIIDDLLRIEETLREKNLKAGDFRETAVERLAAFIRQLSEATTDRAFLTLYRIDGEEVALEVRNIDPSGTMTGVANAHAACVLISGTLSPVESYRRLYFESADVATLSLPNSFPRENRRIVCATDITSAYRMRGDAGHTARVHDYITTFSRVPGNLAVYFPSYDMLNTYTADIPPVLNGKEVFCEPSSSSDAHASLQTFLSLPSRGRCGILFGVCGGKWSEGLDYRGEMLSGALVIGLPLAPYNDVRRIIIGYFRRKFGPEGEFISYTLPAINRALQALGRVLRTPEDTGMLVIGECRFLESGVRRGLPPWMQEEMETCTIASFSREVKAWRS